MKRFVSAWNMCKARKAFTLIEVMVAVLIISVVIMALFEMQGNSSHFFSKFYKKIQVNQIVSFFISNTKYGFEKDSIYLDDLLSDFKVENELRKKFKEIKVELEYEELDRISMSDLADDEQSEETVEPEDEEQSDSAVAFEIGKTIIKLEDTSTYTLRLRIQ